MSTSPTTTRVPSVNPGALHAPSKAGPLEAMGRVVDVGMYVLGAAVDEVERQFAARCGARFAVGLTSGPMR